MSILLDGTGGVTTPGVVNTAGETIATTLNVGNGGLVKDASGNVGIGTASPTVASGLGVVLNGGASQTRLAFKNTYTGDASGDGVQFALLSASSGFIFQNRESDGSFAWETNNTERMRIDSSGRVQINSSADTNYQLSIATKASQGGILTNASTAGFAGVQGIHSSNSATGYAAYFNNSGSGTGLYISNTAAWQSTSDIRLKTDIKDIDSTSRLLQLRPVDYLWKTQVNSDNPEKRNFGFIAQEVQEVFPELVGVSPDGMLSVEYTGLISPLVKAIQELKAIVDAQAVRIAALEA